MHARVGMRWAICNKLSKISPSYPLVRECANTSGLSLAPSPLTGITSQRPSACCEHRASPHPEVHPSLARTAACATPGRRRNGDGAARTGRDCPAIIALVLRTHPWQRGGDRAPRGALRGKAPRLRGGSAKDPHPALRSCAALSSPSRRPPALARAMDGPPRAEGCGPVWNVLRLELPSAASAGLLYTAGAPAAGGMSPEMLAFRVPKKTLAEVGQRGYGIGVDRTGGCDAPPVAGPTKSQGGCPGTTSQVRWIRSVDRKSRSSIRRGARCAPGSDARTPKQRLQPSLTGMLRLSPPKYSRTLEYANPGS